MSPTFHLNLAEFQAANRVHLATTSRSLEEATNSRLSFLLKRAYGLAFPSDAGAIRKRIKGYLEAFALKLAAAGKKGKKAASKMPRRVYRIVQARQTKAGLPGLYGADMRKAAGKFKGKAINSVGYLAAPIAKAWIALGRARGAIPANPKERPQRTAKAFVKPAQAGFSPVALADMMGGFADDQAGEVIGRWEEIFSKAFAGEAAEIRRYLAEKLRKNAVQAGMKVA